MEVREETVRKMYTECNWAGPSKSQANRLLLLSREKQSKSRSHRVQRWEWEENTVTVDTKHVLTSKRDSQSCSQRAFSTVSLFFLPIISVY